MLVRPYRPCTAKDVEAAKTQAAAACQAWARAWLDPVTVSVDVEPMETGGAALRAADPADSWYSLSGEFGTVWAPSSLAAPIAQAMFDEEAVGERRADGLACEVGRQALCSLLCALAGSPLDAAPRLAARPEHLLEAGRPVLRQRIAISSTAVLDMYVELPEKTASSTAAKRPALQALTMGLSGQSVEVRAVLGETEIELGVLHSLAVGDVLRLDGRLDDGIALWIGEKRLPCTGYLGSLDGQLAIEVART